jgi:uncharacterized SAM-binding protein YcdF (DUF218 family)
LNDAAMPQPAIKEAPPDPPPPSLPAFVRYVVAPACTGVLWFLLGPFGLLLALATWLGWYIYEGYAEATMQQR